MKNFQQGSNRAGLALRSSKGFTPIELLVSLVILIILISIVVASLIRTSHKSKIAEFKSQARNIQTAIAADCMDGVLNNKISLPDGLSWVTEPVCGNSGLSASPVLQTTKIAGNCDATMDDTGITAWGANCT